MEQNVLNSLKITSFSHKLLRNFKKEVSYVIRWIIQSFPWRKKPCIHSIEVSWWTWQRIYITRKFDTYLSVYTAEEWEAYVQKISELPEADAEEFQDFILGAAQKCIPDASGRIVLDERLMRHAKIEKNIVFVGSGKQIRVFAEDIWNERESRRDYEKMRQIMRQYGL